jgi:hypothetical protein
MANGKIQQYADMVNLQMAAEAFWQLDGGAASVGWVEQRDTHRSS